MKKRVILLGIERKDLFTLICFFYCVHDIKDNAQTVVCNLPGVIILEESVYSEGLCFWTSTYISKLHTKCTNT